MWTDRSPAKAKTPGEGARPSASGRGMTSCRWFRVWRKSEDGGTAVEFAFVLPVLLMIIAGIMQFGAIFFLQNNMANAAREAARALAVGSIASYLHPAPSSRACGQVAATAGVICWRCHEQEDPGRHR